jgi:hypothetical protein
MYDVCNRGHPGVRGSRRNGAAQAEGQTPADHLSQAERLLSAIPQDSLKKKRQKQLSALRQHFAELVTAYRSNPDTFVPPAITPTTDAGT